MKPSYPLHAEAYRYALHCVDKVYESPMGSNHGPIQVTNPNGGVDFFQEHDFVNGTGYPWCVCFWLTCWAVGANKPFSYLSPGAYALGDWSRQNGLTKPITELIPGDGCVWHEGSGHLSMFESYDENTGLVHTIDGNWGDKVQRATHRAMDLYAGIHIPEDGITPPVYHKPYWVIATSANGHKKILFSEYATRKRVLGILPRLLKRYGINGLTIKKSKIKPK